jgi:hypothetical protein
LLGYRGSTTTVLVGEGGKRFEDRDLFGVGERFGFRASHRDWVEVNDWVSGTPPRVVAEPKKRFENLLITTLGRRGTTPRRSKTHEIRQGYGGDVDDTARRQKRREAIGQEADFSHGIRGATLFEFSVRGDGGNDGGRDDGGCGWCVVEFPRENHPLHELCSGTGIGGVERLMPPLSAVSTLYPVRTPLALPA